MNKKLIESLTVNQQADAHAQLIKQANDALVALNSYADTSDADSTLSISINGNQYTIGLWHADVWHIIGSSLQDIIDFAAGELPDDKKPGNNCVGLIPAGCHKLQPLE
jgi:hypothetical protein